MPIIPTPKIWMNGAMVDWDKATVHIGPHTLHYGTGIFEGVRAYETDRGPGLFRLTPHIERLYRSAHILGMPIGYSVPEIVAATKEVVRSTGLPACYVRPLAYYGYGEMGLDTGPCTVDIAIMAWGWPSVRGPPRMHARGLKLKVSSWRRHDHNIMPPEAKTVGNYVNSSLAKAEARHAGYDDCIMLNPQGFVAECSAENIFVVRDGVVHTPPLSAGLEGITHDTVRTISRDLGYEVRATELSRSDLYIADEIFVCGTASEVNMVASVDDRTVGYPGPIGSAVKAAFQKAARGQDPNYAAWVELAQ